MKKTPKTSVKKSATAALGTPRLYTLEVYLLLGMTFGSTAKKNRKIVRTIQIRGDQTLADLHEVIFVAFDRFDEHLYEFQFGMRRHEGPRYRSRMQGGMRFEEDGVGAAEETTLDSLRLKVGRAFGYWFDFGDDWWHQIEIKAIDADIPEGTYPKVIKRVGESPPQYPDLDEDEDEE